MSAQADAILGTISAIITLVNATKQIYDAAGDAYGLPVAFRAVSSNLPLVQGVLDKIAAQYSANQAASASDTEIVVPAVSACRDNAYALKQIFDKVFPGERASRTERYLAAARTVKPGRSSKVESLMKEIMEKLQLLQQFSLGDGITGLERRQLARGIEELAKVEPSLPAEAKSLGSINQTGQGSVANIGKYQRSIQILGRAGNVAEVQHIYQDRQTEAISSEQPWLVPRQANPRFLGYSQITKHLERRLLPNPSSLYSSGNLVFVLSGMGGVGKSETVLHLLSTRERSLRKRYWGVIWIDCTDLSTAKADFKRLNDLCAWPWDDATGINDTKGRLTSNENHSLLVLDNCDDIKVDYTQYIPHGGRVTTILLSRLSDSDKYSTADPEDVRCRDFVQFTGLDQEAAIALVLSVSGIAERDAATEQAAKQIVLLVDCHPLAITVAGSLIQQGIHSLSEYADALKNRVGQPRLLRTQNVQARYKEIYETFEISVQALEQPIQGTTSGWNALSLLEILAFMKHDEVHEDIFIRAWNYENVICNRDNDDDEISCLSLWHVQRSREWLYAGSTDERTHLFRTARALLCQLSLLTWDRVKKTVSMHSLVHAWARFRIRQPSDLWRKTASILALSCEERVFWSSISTQVQHHIMHLLNDSSTITVMTDPLEFSKIWFVFAMHLGHAHNPKCLEASAMMLEGAMAHWKAQPNSQQVTCALDVVLLVFEISGPVDEAIRMLEQLIKIMEANAEDGLDQSMSQFHLAEVYFRCGKVDEAIQTLEQLVKINEADAEDDQDRSMFQLALASVHMRSGQPGRAIPILEELVNINEADADDDEERSRLQCALAKAYFQDGQFNKAIPLLESVVKVFEAFAEDHPYRLGCQNALALSYIVTGQVGEAIPILESFLKAYEALSEDHPDRLELQRNLAVAEKAIMLRFLVLDKVEEAHV